MDVLAVYEAMGRAVEHTRGGGPFFLEAITYRFRGHSMADPVAYRDKAEEEVWKKKDPITRYGAELLGSGAASQDELDAIRGEVEEEVNAAIAFANESPEPGLDELYRDIYGG